MRITRSRGPDAEYSRPQLQGPRESSTVGGVHQSSQQQVACTAATPGLSGGCQARIKRQKNAKPSHGSSAPTRTLRKLLPTEEIGGRNPQQSEKKNGANRRRTKQIGRRTACLLGSQVDSCYMIPVLTLSFCVYCHSIHGHSPLKCLQAG